MAREKEGLGAFVFPYFISSIISFVSCKDRNPKLMAIIKIVFS